MSSYEAILNLFVDLVIKSNDFTVDGIEKAFQKFKESLTVHEHKPKNSSAPSDFVKTTLREAVERAKQPVYIIADYNRFGNLESKDYPGLIFIKNGENQLIAHGIQDGSKIQPLTMNAILCCMANGWLYDRKNTAGSANVCENPMATVVEK